MKRYPRHRQRGSSLLISLIMLVVLTLLVVAAINSVNTHTKITGNMQTKAEAQAATQQAIEQVISQNFTANPQSVTVTVNINNDTTNDYTVSVAKPTCISNLSVKNTELDINDPDDQACFLGDGKLNSLCNDTQWDVQATISDTLGSGVNASTHQGIAVRVPIGTGC